MTTRNELKNKTIAAISLGCDKNKVDLQHMLSSLANYGFKLVDSLDDADIIIVNTCAFILPAKQEAIENILLAVEKKKNRCEKVIVTGCLPQRNLEELQESLSEVDFFLLFKDNDKIVNIIEKMYGFEPSKLSVNEGRILNIHSGYAHLKIADGCNNGCSFCAIPRIRGRYRSVEIKKLVKEAKELCENKNIKEIILVAQDVTRYGFDLYGENKLIELLDELSKIRKLQWIRIHYAYPELINDKLLSYISSNEKICKYIDIPLQHVDNDILKCMNRRIDEEKTRELIKNIKSNYPNIVVRTTFIVGYPNETRKAFKKLCDFLKASLLDNVGFFKYYKEENTKAFFLKKQIPEFIKNHRLKKVQKIQSHVANKNNLRKIGKIENVMIDEKINGGYLGHDKSNSPEVDFGIIIYTDRELVIGDIYSVEFKDYRNKYLIGELKNESSK